MKESTPNVLISVLNWNNAKDTISCVKSLQLLNYPLYNIVVVDNASRDDSAEKIQQEFPDILLLRSKENLGYAGGNKLGWEWGKDKGFDLLWIVNNDAMVIPNCLTAFAKAYQKYGNAIYGGISLEPDNETISFGGGREFIKTENVDYNLVDIYYGQKQSMLKSPIPFRQVAYVTGANMVIPFEVIDKYGYIDSSFFMYGEELDYCFKLRVEHNIPTYHVPDAIIVHHDKASFKKNDQLTSIGKYYSLRNWTFFQMNHLLKKRWELIKHDSSIWQLILTYLKLVILGEDYFLKDVEHATSLAFLHAIMGIKGKTFEPNNYI